jgi:1-acyl-sn-glycerol-3-phosphate acyltransferase
VSPETKRSGRLRAAHIDARTRGVLRPLYAFVRMVLEPLLRAWFRVRISGAEHIPPSGAAIIAPNHKSFLDAFFIALATRRHLRYMAKAELFSRPFARLLVRLGAFPVRRGAADAEALETCRAILGRGGLVVVFPEGTRVDEPDALGSPHHGAGRLALETGAPIVPAAITGTHRLWLGPIPKPRRVQVAFLEPVQVVEVDTARDALSELIDRRVWPAVQEEYGRLAATPGLVAAALTIIGAGGLVARRQRKGRSPRLLGKLEPLSVRRRKRRGGRLRLLRRR